MIRSRQIGGFCRKIPGPGGFRPRGAPHGGESGISVLTHRGKTFIVPPARSGLDRLPQIVRATDDCERLRVLNLRVPPRKKDDQSPPEVAGVLSPPGTRCFRVFLRLGPGATAPAGCHWRLVRQCESPNDAGRIPASRNRALRQRVIRAETSMCGGLATTVA